MDNEKEISFGAFDSELMHQEIFIPEGFTATIDGNKIILTKIENEDERVRKAILELVRQSSEILDKQNQNNMIAWLEKQTEVESDKDDIEAEEKDIRKAFNKIWEEKQGEQKSEDKIKPKFKAGDWITIKE